MGFKQIRGNEESTVNLPSMPNVEHRHSHCLIVDFVDDSVVACSNAPGLVASLQFLTTIRSRVLTKRQQSLFHQLKKGLGHFVEDFLNSGRMTTR
jgi:hypothetical protein